MAKEKDNKRWIKIATLVLLGLMVIGFSVPGFIDFQKKETPVEQRVCQNDADCYLLCNDIPQKALCSQNLCQQNACGEKTYYPFELIPKSFTLVTRFNSTILDLSSRSDSRNMFVVFQGHKAKVYSSNMSLAQVLEKAKIQIDSKCLTLGEKKHCDGRMQMRVNGTETYSYGDYLPKENDLIEVIYSNEAPIELPEPIAVFG